MSEGARRVAVVGTRGWSETEFGRTIVRDSVFALVADLATRRGLVGGEVVVVSGGAEGPDAWAVEAATEYGLPFVVHRPDYRKDWWLAPKLRNLVIVDDCTELHAFWDGWSGGTAHVVALAASRGKILEPGHVRVFEKPPGKKAPRTLE